jgi:capsule polysaccharide export protein KpsE/RkpR
MDDPQSETPASEFLSQTPYVDSDGDEEPGEALSLKLARFLRLCWERRRLVFGILFIGILCSLLIALRSPIVYTSTTTVVPGADASPSSKLMGLMGGSGAMARIGSEALGLSVPGELFVGILQSRSVSDSLITRFNLLQYYNAHLMEDARRSLAANTKIESDRKSGIISISFTANNPILASNIAHQYVVELNRVVNESSASSARRERIFLETRLKDVKQELDDSAKALSQFSTKSRTIDMPTQAKSMVDAGLKLQGELIESRSELAALRQTYSEDNSRVRAVEARNAELQRQMNELDGLNRKSGASDETDNSGYPSAIELPFLGLTYYDLDRKMRVDEALWEALTKQYETAKVEEAAETPTVRVLDTANVPERKSGPHRSIILMVGGLLSLLAACASVLALSIWEGMAPEDEPKKLICETAGAVMNRQRWYWSMPGMGWVHGRLNG